MYKSIVMNQIVEDVPKAAVFYIEALGFKPVYGLEPDESGNVDFELLRKDGVEIMMSSRKSIIEEFQVADMIGEKPSSTLYISVEDIDTLYLELKDTCEIVRELADTSYCAREFAIVDESGYILTFSSYKEGDCL